MDGSGLVIGIAWGWGSGPHERGAGLRILHIGIDGRGMMMMHLLLLPGGQACAVLITWGPTLGVLSIHREIVCGVFEGGRLGGRTRGGAAARLRRYEDRGGGRRGGLDLTGTGSEGAVAILAFDETERFQSRSHRVETGRIVEEEGKGGGGRDRGDRKSTRLNSSH